MSAWVDRTTDVTVATLHVIWHIMFVTVEITVIVTVMSLVLWFECVCNLFTLYFECVCFLLISTVSVDSPLYIHPHSKAVLTSAITHDTQFLAKHLVMDYSLLVGVDETNNQLLIGIIGNLFASCYLIDGWRI